MRHLILFIFTTTTISAGCQTTCTILDCQPPMKAICYPWCFEEALKTGSSVEIARFTGNVKKSGQYTKQRDDEHKDPSVAPENAFLSLLTPQERSDVDQTKKDHQKILNSLEKSNDARVIFPQDLFLIIKQQQLLNVEESCATPANRCFTDMDLHDFENGGIIQQMVAQVRTDSWFEEIVISIKETSPRAQSQLFAQAQQVRRQTWAEQGGINCKGQTDAGADAEGQIARAIVELAKEMMSTE